MSSFERKARRSRARNRGPRVRGMEVVTDREYLRSRLDECDCPGVVRVYDDMNVVNRYHRHGCKSLRRWSRDQ